VAGELILVVDDEMEIRDLIYRYLARENYRVVTADCGVAALHMAFKHQPDLIILDILLPDYDGIEVCYQLRTRTSVPVLFLSCKDADEDKILGLGVGGDDYITKPFSPGVLVARVKAHLRRANLPEMDEDSSQVLRFPGLEIDLASYTVRVGDENITLPAKEFEILSLMAKTPNRLFRTEQLYNQVWKEHSIGDTRTVMVHISNLRKKIEKDPANPSYILTVRGIGYKFNTN